MENVSRMKELISRLNQAAKVYYQGQGEVMSNFEYDKLYEVDYHNGEVINDLKLDIVDQDDLIAYE